MFPSGNTLSTTIYRDVIIEPDQYWDTNAEKWVYDNVAVVFGGFSANANQITFSHLNSLKFTAAWQLGNEGEKNSVINFVDIPDVQIIRLKILGGSTARIVNSNVTVGYMDGNTPKGRTEGTANAHVQGRNVEGTLPKPSYESQLEGTVVVQVKVDQYGTVTEAIPGAEGTTVTDKTLWNAARNAALKAHFNQSANAPALQTGTITYIFKLK